MLRLWETDEEELLREQGIDPRCAAWKSLPQPSLEDYFSSKGPQGLVSAWAKSKAAPELAETAKLLQLLFSTRDAVLAFLSRLKGEITSIPPKDELLSTNGV